VARDDFWESWTRAPGLIWESDWYWYCHAQNKSSESRNIKSRFHLYDEIKQLDLFHFIIYAYWERQMHPRLFLISSLHVHLDWYLGQKKCLLSFQSKSEKENMIAPYSSLVCYEKMLQITMLYIFESCFFLI
jgi:hypothetical protein